MHSTCPASKVKSAAPSPFCLVQDGVDLNRNFGFDWTKLSDTCAHIYPGTQPFSEPESQAIRKVLFDYQVHASMGFHTRATGSRPALLIHPFASPQKTTQRDMPMSDQIKFQQIGQSLNRQNQFIIGDAVTAIQYTSPGTCLDWLYSVNVTPFVMEVPPPCSHRWCPTTAHTFEKTRTYGLVAQHYVHIWRNYQITGTFPPAATPEGTTKTDRFKMDQDFDASAGGAPPLAVIAVILILLGWRRNQQHIVVWWRRFWNGKKSKGTAGVPAAM
uniref:Peptidase M14 domain-containing protein n=1 Tax=Entomoneis paludosa TaxID=265537 RepID=A0A7S3DP79_9STRA|eukprot:CAMPEP_0172468156 /NCGR_PEP_ID=MMETSP1065-20121228/60829_1 /TAXON_ID=265537 /ORGANISM="Amphiprora paludosa, Strain CCMP125" /LENGTH=271 /DNA_ID=CAMNT_0013225501 /DNA_START=12 /DNA_END=827 /DNA_ORIENTATION=-